jgi:arylsulfatase A-like enzyme
VLFPEIEACPCSTFTERGILSAKLRPGQRRFSGCLVGAPLWTEVEAEQRIFREVTPGRYGQAESFDFHIRSCLRFEKPADIIQSMLGRINCWLLAGLTALGCLSAARAQNNARVVLVSIDGLAAFHLENRNLELPNIRQLIAEGVWAEGSQTVFPAVTHPSHTTIVTGMPPRIHGVIGNRMRNRETEESFHITNRPRLQSVRVPTLFDAAKKKGLTTAAFFWPETRDDPSIDYNVSEVFNDGGLADIRATRPALIADLQQAGIPIDLYFKWYSQEHLRAAGDVILTQAASHILRRHRPHLLAVHLLATDVMQHEYGPQHYLAHNAVTVADYCVGILRDAVEEAGLADDTTFIVTADHGFQTAEYDLNLAPLFERAGLQDQIRLHSQGWNLFVELRDDFDPDVDQPKLEDTLQKALEIEGVASMVQPAEFHTLGFPRYEEDPHVPGHFLLLADVDTHFSSDPSLPELERTLKKNPYHGHGNRPQGREMLATFVAAGRQVRTGVRIGRIRHLDIAPTIAALLQLSLNPTEGRVLHEMLSH